MQPQGVYVMPSASKDRIRVTLHVDREIYRLAKIWSRFSEKPLSRLFDEAFEPHVKCFKYPTPEDWELAKQEQDLLHRVEDFEDAAAREEKAIELFEEEQAREKYLENLPEEERKKILMKAAEEHLKKQQEIRQKWINALKEES